MGLQHFRHRYLFRHISNFGSGKVNEVVPWVMLFYAHASPNEHWPFASLSWCFPFAQSSCCRGVVVSISLFEIRILIFLLEMSLGQQLQSAIIILPVAKCRLLSEDLQISFSILPTFNLHRVQTSQHAVRRSVSDCCHYFVPLCVEGLNVVAFLLEF